MKRSIRRIEYLPSFSLGLAELCLLWTRLEPLFEGDKDKSFYVEVDFDDETLTLDSIDELRSAQYPRSESSTFALHCHGTERSIHIYTPPHSGRQSRLSVVSESEIWIAGGCEVVLNIIEQNRAWHHWLRPKVLDFLLLLLLLIAVGVTAVSITSTRWGQPGAGTLGLLGASLVLASLLFGRNRLLPAATLRLNEVESVWRRYSVELTMAFAFLSVLIAGVSLFLPKP